MTAAGKEKFRVTAMEGIHFSQIGEYVQSCVPGVTHCARDEDTVTNKRLPGPALRGPSFDRESGRRAFRKGHSTQRPKDGDDQVR